MNKKKLFTILSSTAIFLSLHSATPSVSANSQKLNDLQQQQQELNQQSNQLQGNITDTENQMNSLEAERNQLQEDITRIQGNIDRVIGEIAEQEEEIARLEEEINQLNIEIEILQENIEKRNEALAQQARGVQTTGSPNSIIDIILSAESLSELVGKMEVINVLVKNNNSIMKDQIRDKELVEAAKAEIDEKKAAADQVKLDLEVSRNNLLAQRMELDSKIQLVTEKFDLTIAERDSLLNQKAEIAAKTDQIAKDMQAEKDRLAAEEARRIAEEKRRAEEAARQRAAAEQAAQEAEARQRQVQTASTSVAAPAPAPAPSANPGGWVRPASGYVSSRFGYRIHPISGASHLHSGIDIAGGGPIRAAKGGTVTTASYHYSYGYYVVVNHGGGLSTLYAHMTPGLMVAPGQSVSAGQQVGTMGTTGSSTGVHLHFEIRSNGSPVNPEIYMGF